MFGLIFMTKKKKQSLEEIVQSIQQGDHTLENELIETYKPFIAKSVSSICKRYITETDDEFSIGLIAFSEAVQKYDPSKGSSLLSFADILIKRKVIDYIRSQAKYKNISIEINDEHEEDSQHSSIEAQLSIDEFHRKTESEYRKSEIIQFAGILQQYNLSFDELVKNSPKHADARKNAMKVAQTLVEQEELKQYLLEKKKLPIKQLEETVKVSRKTIERNRKYIMAISLILLGDYLYLRDYIKGVLET